MSDKQLHGHHPWGPAATSESDRNVTPAATQVVTYTCPRGHQVEVPFSAQSDVVVPPTWRCRQHGVECVLTTLAAGPNTNASAKSGKAPRTPLVMLHERRSYAELDEILDWALARARAHRGA